jgi:hypothetical protein
MTTSPEPRVAARSPSTRVPEFFIVGHHKCGTTALYEMLRRHPQIFMPDLKEPWFLAGDPRVLFQPSSPLPKTLEEYLSLFAAARSDQRLGEATPSYLMSPTAAATIAELQPDARIIAILREPASFLRSLHLQRLQIHAETEPDLAKALALEEQRRAGKAIPRDAIRPEDLLYSDHVRYVEQLRRYHAVFPAEQMLVLIYDDFRADNESTVRQVLRFLDVDATSPLELVEANPTVRIRSQRAYHLLRSLYLGRGPAARATKAVIKALTPTRLRRDANAAIEKRVLYGDPRQPDEALMLELRRRFKGEVVAAGEYLGRDLVSLWGYDRID